MCDSGRKATVRTLDLWQLIIAPKVIVVNVCSHEKRSFKSLEVDWVEGQLLARSGD
jgi:hypothetical protein